MITMDSNIAPPTDPNQLAKPERSSLSRVMSDFGIVSKAGFFFVVFTVLALITSLIFILLQDDNLGLGAIGVVGGLFFFFIVYASLVLGYYLISLAISLVKSVINKGFDSEGGKFYHFVVLLIFVLVAVLLFLNPRIFP